MSKPLAVGGGAGYYSLLPDSANGGFHPQFPGEFPDIRRRDALLVRLRERACESLLLGGPIRALCHFVYESLRCPAVGSRATSSQTV